ncbi:pentapeptide repeat-containing protein [Paraburkholderia ginsengisoli]|uniref:Pentapeptide repeat-containing protein n=1 Tax=Paraburkholderia ginsengisoli TaxID=311231 RepID=A0A7T4T923_9BURK|nr:pentapeptide repeat-containing protein [Paraburkholderia ginsengisoli]QQC64038.1 pentapeptide repeat-containing protein [Paraburkholderia ginsengisoli]
MPLDSTTPAAAAPSHAVSDATLTRADVERLIGARHADSGNHAPLHFTDCDFEGTDLSRLDLRGAEFHRCTIVETSFFGASLAHSRWIRCRGREADFGSADLVDAAFQSSDLNNTSWRRAKLASASFRGCKLTGANFEACTALGLSFVETLLVGAHLRGLSFRKATLQQLDFSDADVAGVDFREAIFDGGSLRNAHLKGARFDGADLREADLSGVRLVDAALFKGATISHQQAAVLVTELGLRVM